MADSIGTERTDPAAGDRTVIAVKVMQWECTMAFEPAGWGSRMAITLAFTYISERLCRLRGGGVVYPVALYLVV